MKIMEPVTRFCVSVEQMVPLLENLCNGERELTEDDENGDQQNGDSSLPPVEPNPEECIEEPINYIDLTDLNPIIEADNCLQTDDLIEGIWDFSSVYVQFVRLNIFDTINAGMKTFVCPVFFIIYP